MNIIKRFDAPNKMDQVPKGTICIVYAAFRKSREVWEQMSEDWENPHWEQIPDSPDIPSQF
jgi:hypothetical protein